MSLFLQVFRNSGEYRGKGWKENFWVDEFVCCVHSCAGFVNSSAGLAVVCCEENWQFLVFLTVFWLILIYNALTFYLKLCGLTCYWFFPSKITSKWQPCPCIISQIKRASRLSCKTKKPYATFSTTSTLSLLPLSSPNLRPTHSLSQRLCKYFCFSGIFYHLFFGMYGKIAIHFFVFSLLFPFSFSRVFFIVLQPLFAYFAHAWRMQWKKWMQSLEMMEAGRKIAFLCFLPCFFMFIETSRRKLSEGGGRR